MSLAIHTSDLAWRAGRDFALRDVALHVPAGSLYGFLGPNGSGKTTTIRLLLGLLRPAGGSITVLGRPVPSAISEVLARTGYVPERPHIYPTHTVGEALDYHSAFYPAWSADWASELVAGFRLDRARRVSALSKGETGKLMILLALAQRPELLVLDEPTDGLDPVVRRDVLGAVLEYVSQTGATVFLSSHLVHELERICDWVGVMDAGRLVTEMPMQRFKNGIKRLRVMEAPAELSTPPFSVLSRQPNGAGELMVVNGWEPAMSQYFESVGATLREVADLDLEEGFVELLRASRQPSR
ncbi:MAG TPA: ABC transporter ATP-binding protein [Gemmatimonadaceae bacterium]|nr:ABC transporter ATP-binding protein [Gemmatimonadaceae bacterium]